MAYNRGPWVNPEEEERARWRDTFRGGRSPGPDSFRGGHSPGPDPFRGRSPGPDWRREGDWRGHSPSPYYDERNGGRFRPDERGDFDRGRGMYPPEEFDWRRYEGGPPGEPGRGFPRDDFEARRYPPMRGGSYDRVGDDDGWRRERDRQRHREELPGKFNDTDERKLVERSERHSYDNQPPSSSTYHRGFDEALRVTVDNDRYHPPTHDAEPSSSNSSVAKPVDVELPDDASNLARVREVAQKTREILSKLGGWRQIGLQPVGGGKTEEGRSGEGARVGDEGLASGGGLVLKSNSAYTRLSAQSSVAQTLLRNISLMASSLTGNTNQTPGIHTAVISAVSSANQSTMASVTPPIKSSTGQLDSGEKSFDTSVAHVLKSIGFDFELSKLMQEKAKERDEKEKKERDEKEKRERLMEKQRALLVKQLQLEQLEIKRRELEALRGGGSVKDGEKSSTSQGAQREDRVGGKKDEIYDPFSSESEIYISKGLSKSDGSDDRPLDKSFNIISSSSSSSIAAISMALPVVSHVYPLNLAPPPVLNYPPPPVGLLPPHLPPQGGFVLPPGYPVLPHHLPPPPGMFGGPPMHRLPPPGADPLMIGEPRMGGQGLHYPPPPHSDELRRHPEHRASDTTLWEKSTQQFLQKLQGHQHKERITNDYEEFVISSDSDSESTGRARGRKHSVSPVRGRKHTPSPQKRSDNSMFSPSPNRNKGERRRTPSPVRIRDRFTPSPNRNRCSQSPVRIRDDFRRTLSPNRNRDGSRRTPSPNRIRDRSRHTPSPQRDSPTSGWGDGRLGPSPARGHWAVSPPNKRFRRDESFDIIESWGGERQISPLRVERDGRSDSRGGAWVNRSRSRSGQKFRLRSRSRSLYGSPGVRRMSPGVRRSRSRSRERERGRHTERQRHTERERQGEVERDRVGQESRERHRQSDRSRDTQRKSETVSGMTRDREKDRKRVTVNDKVRETNRSKERDRKTDTARDTEKDRNRGTERKSDTFKDIGNDMNKSSTDRQADTSIDRSREMEDRSKDTDKNSDIVRDTERDRRRDAERKSDTFRDTEKDRDRNRDRKSDAGRDREKDRGRDADRRSDTVRESHADRIRETERERHRDPVTHLSRDRESERKSDTHRSERDRERRSATARHTESRSETKRDRDTKDDTGKDSCNKRDSVKSSSDEVVTDIPIANTTATSEDSTSIVTATVDEIIAVACDLIFGRYATVSTAASDLAIATTDDSAATRDAGRDSCANDATGEAVTSDSMTAVVGVNVEDIGARNTDASTGDKGSTNKDEVSNTTGLDTVSSTATKIDCSRTVTGTAGSEIANPSVGPAVKETESAVKAVKLTETVKSTEAKSGIAESAVVVAAKLTAESAKTKSVEKAAVENVKIRLPGRTNESKSERLSDSTAKNRDQAVCGDKRSSGADRLSDAGDRSTGASERSSSAGVRPTGASERSLGAGDRSSGADRSSSTNERSSDSSSRHKDETRSRQLGNKDKSVESALSVSDKVGERSRQTSTDTRRQTERGTSSRQPGVTSVTRGEEECVYHCYDGGEYVCKRCEERFDKIGLLLKHLHTELHNRKVNRVQSPWIKKSKSNNSNNSSSSKARTVIVVAKGEEFIFPATAYYCSLCEEFMGDRFIAEEHFLSNSHYMAYLKYNKSRPSKASATNDKLKSPSSAGAQRSGSTTKRGASETSTDKNPEKLARISSGALSKALESGGLDGGVRGLVGERNKSQVVSSTGGASVVPETGGGANSTDTSCKRSDSIDKRLGNENLLRNIAVEVGTLDNVVDKENNLDKLKSDKMDNSIEQLDIKPASADKDIICDGLVKVARAQASDFFDMKSHDTVKVESELDSSIQVDGGDPVDKSVSRNQINKSASRGENAVSILSAEGSEADVLCVSPTLNTATLSVHSSGEEVESNRQGEELHNQKEELQKQGVKLEEQKVESEQQSQLNDEQLSGEPQKKLSPTDEDQMVQELHKLESMVVEQLGLSQQSDQLEVEVRQLFQQLGEELEQRHYSGVVFDGMGESLTQDSQSSDVFNVPLSTVPVPLPDIAEMTIKNTSTLPLLQTSNQSADRDVQMELEGSFAQSQVHSSVQPDISECLDVITDSVPLYQPTTKSTVASNQEVKQNISGQVMKNLPEGETATLLCDDGSAVPSNLDSNKQLCNTSICYGEINCTEMYSVTDDNIDNKNIITDVSNGDLAFSPIMSTIVQSTLDDLDMSTELSDSAIQSINQLKNMDTIVTECTFENNESVINRSTETMQSRVLLEALKTKTSDDDLPSNVQSERDDNIGLLGSSSVVHGYLDKSVIETGCGVELITSGLSGKAQVTSVVTSVTAAVSDNLTEVSHTTSEVESGTDVTPMSQTITESENPSNDSKNSYTSTDFTNPSKYSQLSHNITGSEKLGDDLQISEAVTKSETIPPTPQHVLRSGRTQVSSEQRAAVKPGRACQQKFTGRLSESNSSTGSSCAAEQQRLGEDDVGAGTSDINASDTAQELCFFKSIVGINDVVSDDVIYYSNSNQFGNDEVVEGSAIASVDGSAVEESEVGCDINKSAATENTVVDSLSAHTPDTVGEEEFLEGYGSDNDGMMEFIELDRIESEAEED